MQNKDSTPKEALIKGFTESKLPLKWEMLSIPSHGTGNGWCERSI
jgi:hypothetical protein